MTSFWQLSLLKTTDLMGSKHIYNIILFHQNHNASYTKALVSHYSFFSIASSFFEHLFH